ncbi:hypothetical protein ACFY0A_37400 [Streptomyces sp. NPDC001698]|uniref:hypothetical protein n=1 Tax=Streptomyces sp. NPDC001698 TaxID=3364601 RepID=UPI0036A70697
MTGTAAALRLVEHGIAELLGAGFDVKPLAANTWADTGLEVLLPSAGLYQLDVTVRASLTIDSPANVWVLSRVWDVTAGSVVPRSEALVNQHSLMPIPELGAQVMEIGDNRTATTALEYAVPAPSVLRLQASWAATRGTPKRAGIGNDALGRTMIRFNRIA